MSFAVSNRVVARNGIGQFISECETAAHDTIEKAVERGATLSRGFAPKGARRDPRTPHLADSIKAEVLSRTSGRWVATARHALAQEKGGAPHLQTGMVTFFWENEGRMWDPGFNLIHHPGNPAHPYLRPAYTIIMRDIMQIARGEYPG